MSEYNQDQLKTLEAVRTALDGLPQSERETLGATIEPYLAFREAVDRFFDEFFLAACRDACFKTGLSACCGFESIVTFATDHAINLLVSDNSRIEALVEVLTRPNTGSHCVYLGPNGCLWRLRPISCAMFLCGQLKQRIFETQPDCAAQWNRFQEEEKRFTFPDRPVLFDILEAKLIELGVDSPHLYFHRSPGLLSVKERAGLWRRPVPGVRRRPLRPGS